MKWHIAQDHDAGAIVAETGGVRKMRWAAHGKGKSGSARIICYYYSDDMPLFMLFAFSKSERENLSDREKLQMRRLTG